MTALRAAALVVACAPALLGAAGLPAGASAKAGEPEVRRVYVTAVDGAGAPVTGLTRRGTYWPMPNPLSRIQLL